MVDLPTPDPAQAAKDKRRADLQRRQQVMRTAMKHMKEMQQQCMNCRASLNDQPFMQGVQNDIDAAMQKLESAHKLMAIEWFTVTEELEDDAQRR